MLTVISTFRLLNGVHILNLVALGISVLNGIYPLFQFSDTRFNLIYNINLWHLNMYKTFTYAHQKGNFVLCMSPLSVTIAILYERPDTVVVPKECTHK